VQADVVYLKNGAHFEGVVTRETDAEVVLTTERGTMQFPRADVERIERKPFTRVDIPRPQPAPAAEPAAPTPATPPPAPTAPAPAAAPAELQFNSLQELELPARDYWLQGILLAKDKGVDEDSGRDHLGYTHIAISPLADKSGYLLNVESVLLKYSRRLDSYFLLEARTNKKLELLSYTVQSIAGRERVKTVGAKQGDKLVLTVTTDAGSQQRTIDYPADAVFCDSSVFQLTAGSPVSPGTRRQYRYLELINGVKGVEQVEVLRAESVQAPEGKFDTWVTKSSTVLPDSPPAELTRWVSQRTERDPGGMPLKVEIGGTTLVYEAATAADAVQGVEDFVNALGVRKQLLGAAEGTPAAAKTPREAAP
jgi:hypothetical protein